MIVFLHIRKTAGSTFQFILGNTFGPSACHTNHTKREVFTQADFEFARKFFPRLRSIAGHNLINPLALAVPDAFHMTFVRDPIGRAISQYQDNVILNQHALSFEESLRTQEKYHDVQVRVMAGERNLDKAKFYLEQCAFVGLTEKFDLSLHVLQKLSPFRLNLHYKRRRAHQDNSIKQSLMKDSRALEMIREYNKLDMDLYSFAANEIFPKLCEKAKIAPDAKVASFEKYSTEYHPKFLLGEFYNMLFYRQTCKLIRRNGAGNNAAK